MVVDADGRPCSGFATSQREYDRLYLAWLRSAALERSRRVSVQCYQGVDFDERAVMQRARGNDYARRTVRSHKLGVLRVHSRPQSDVSDVEGRPENTGQVSSGRKDDGCHGEQGT
jgi:hypothetical protein